MSRRKEEHEKEPNHERWLVSYADFITLLFAVFVVLYAMSQVDQARVAKVIASSNEAFGLAKSSSAPVFNVIDSDATNMVPVPDPLRQPSTASDIAKEEKKKIKQRTKTKDPIDEAFKTPTIVPLPPGQEKAEKAGEKGAGPEATPPADTEKEGQPQTVAPVASVPEQPEITEEKVKADTHEFEKIKENIVEFLQEKQAEGKVTLVVGPRGLVISLKDTEFFESGKATVRAESKHLLDNISAAIGKYSNAIRIEGHTDNIPIKTAVFPSNWELSTARATNIVHYLIATHALPPERLSAIGYGEYRPIAENNTEEGRQKNRRVDVVLLSSAGEQGEPISAAQAEKEATAPETHP